MRASKRSSIPELTRPGVLNDASALEIHSNTAQDAEEYGLASYSSDFGIFPFHEVCWILLLAQLDNVMTSKSVTLEQLAIHLFNLFYCITLDKWSILKPQHDYEGLPNSLRHPYDHVLSIMQSNNKRTI